MFHCVLVRVRVRACVRDYARARARLCLTAVAHAALHEDAAVIRPRHAHQIPAQTVQVNVVFSLPLPR